jgi:hypothetical protein
MKLDRIFSLIDTAKVYGANVMLYNPGNPGSYTLIVELERSRVFKLRFQTLKDVEEVLELLIEALKR